MALIVLTAATAVATVVALLLVAVLVAMGEEVKRLQRALAAAKRTALPTRSANVIGFSRRPGL